MPNLIGIVVEGDRREVDYWSNLEKCFFRDTELVFIPLPAGKNIYMLWKQMTDDDFDTDIIEVVRECGKSAKTALEDYSRDDFQEIYLLFDYDPHQQNISPDKETGDDVLSEMLAVFDNETENGKLYISYPMCEALRDVNDMSCIPVSSCEFPISSIDKYKNATGNKNPYSHYRRYTSETWEMFIAVFLHRCRCLHGNNSKDDELISWYKREVSPRSIFQHELVLKNNGTVFVLSAYPEFLIDYFKIEKFAFLRSQVIKIQDCGSRKTFEL